MLDIPYGIFNSFPTVERLVSVSQLDRFMLTRRGTRWDKCTECA